MPTRNLVYEALVLRARESPAGDRILTLMTAESGLVDVFAFGGPKSKLRSLASPYASGRAFVYLDPVKDFRKISDFEVQDSFPALREDLGRLWSAGLIAELLVKTSGGGGDFPLVLELSREALRCLDREVGERSDYPTSLFLWRLVGLLGLGPDPSGCASCGRPLAPVAPPLQPGERPPGPCAYSSAIEGFLCPNCTARALAREEAERGGYGESGRGPVPVRSASALLRLDAAVLRWLMKSEGLSFHEAAAVELAEGARAGLKALTFALTRRAADSPLASFAPGVLTS